MEKTKIVGSIDTSVQSVLTPDAIAFLVALQTEFNPAREKLLARRTQRHKEIEAGNLPTFLPETRSIREGDWKVASCPADLQDRRVEITGPTERKMMINALNSGALVFMADLEDASSPTWENMIQGQVNLRDAVRRQLSFQNPDGKKYELNSKTATLLVRPRGWHLLEKNFLVNGQPISGSLFDFGLYFFHNAQETLKRGTGPYFYLPKMESHLEARLWNDVFCFAQNYLKIPHGTIRATVLIETIMAAFEMDEILYELRDHASGLNAGRWDYIFSCIKKFKHQDVIFPDRGQITMTVPFMRSYTELLVKTCHRRGAHAMGGMAAFIPNRKDPEVTANALTKVREDKTRESNDGFDGTWVAHPDLVPVAKEIFDAKLGSKPNQKDRLRSEVSIRPEQLIDFKVPGGTVSEAGVRNNINVAIQYMERWLAGVGAVAIHNLMEDAATAEISRAQLWQWLNREVALADGRKLTPSLFEEFFASELKALGGTAPFQKAATLLKQLVQTKNFEEFLTLPAYERLMDGPHT